MILSSNMKDCHMEPVCYASGEWVRVRTGLRWGWVKGREPSCDFVGFNGEGGKTGRSSYGTGGINDGVAASLQLSQIHYHMLILKLQRHTISIKIQESRELNTKTSANYDIQDLPKDIKIIKTKIVKGDC
ncbi:hypothetical protein Tco_0493258 [Tanacetum coccineum]